MKPVVDAPTGESLPKRSIWWAMEFNRLLIKNPELQDQIPDGATVCVMPESDPELTSYNLSLITEKPADRLILVSMRRSGDEYSIVPFLPGRQVRQAAA